jgi:hypothetical protein
MKTGDIGNGDIGRLFDDLRSLYPQLLERLEITVRLRHGRLYPAAHRRRVLELVDAELSRLLERVISLRRPEPRRASYLNGLASIVAFLNPVLEQTGGNYRASV